MHGRFEIAQGGWLRSMHVIGNRRMPIEARKRTRARVSGCTGCLNHVYVIIANQARHNQDALRTPDLIQTLLDFIHNPI